MAGGHKWDSDGGAAARRARGAYAAHTALRAAGRKVASEAHEARRIKARQRRLAAVLDAAPTWECNAVADSHGGRTDASDDL